MTDPGDRAVIVEDHHDGVLVIRLNRPEVRNAMNAQLVEELHEVMRAAALDGTLRAIVLTGEGEAFCSGLDLGSYGSAPGAEPSEGRVQRRLRVQQHISDLGDAFRRSRAPVVAAINGDAIGGGMALALLCDLRVMATGKSMSAAMVRVGLTGGDMGLSWLLPRVIGLTRSLELQLTGRPIDANEALATGLVNRVTGPEAVVSEALALAAAVAANAPFGIWMTREVTWANLESPSFRAAVDMENRGQMLATFTEDHREAVAAFAEHRPPLFGNR